MHASFNLCRFKVNSMAVYSSQDIYFPLLSCFFCLQGRRFDDDAVYRDLIGMPQPRQLAPQPQLCRGELPCLELLHVNIYGDPSEVRSHPTDWCNYFHAISTADDVVALMKGYVPGIIVLYTT